MATPQVPSLNLVGEPHDRHSMLSYSLNLYLRNSISQIRGYVNKEKLYLREKRESLSTLSILGSLSERVHHFLSVHDHQLESVVEHDVHGFSHIHRVVKGVGLNADEPIGCAVAEDCGKLVSRCPPCAVWLVAMLALYTMQA